jgi:hypothetical protein
MTAAEAAAHQDEKSRRTLALPQNVVAALRKHRKWQAEARLAAGPLWQDTGLVFTTSVATPLDAPHVRRDFRALIRAVDAAARMAGWDSPPLTRSVLASTTPRPRC